MGIRSARRRLPPGSHNRRCDRPAAAVVMGGAVWGSLSEAGTTRSRRPCIRAYMTSSRWSDGSTMVLSLWPAVRPTRHPAGVPFRPACPNNRSSIWNAGTQLEHGSRACAQAMHMIPPGCPKSASRRANHGRKLPILANRASAARESIAWTTDPGRTALATTPQAMKQRKLCTTDAHGRNRPTRRGGEPANGCCKAATGTAGRARS